MNTNAETNIPETPVTPATHYVTVGGETSTCNSATMLAVCDALYERHPEAFGTTPVIVPITPPASIAPRVAVVIDVPRMDKVAPIAAGKMDVLGAARSMTDYDAAVANGFAPRQPHFTRGLRVNDVGVDNARKARLEYEAKPTVTEYCGDFIGQIESEQRRDVMVRTGRIRMNREGGLLVGSGGPLLATPQTVRGLTTRLGCGGSSYLASVKPELRAINLNHHCRDLQVMEDSAVDDKGEQPEPSKSLVRVRRNPLSGCDEAFALVSDRYTSFDVDRIAESLKLAVPADARGAVEYDGTHAKFEVLFHTTVQPDQFVAGEFFRAGVIIETDDDGTGGLNVSSVLFQNLCLNLIVIDEAASMTARIRHVGSVVKLANAFRAAFRASLTKIAPFMVKWGQACEEDALARALRAAEVEGPISIHEALPGLFNGIIERELVPVRLGRSDADKVGVLKSLVDMYDRDDSGAKRGGIVTRAAVVNAFTRYAHEGQGDAQAEVAIQRAASGLLWGRGTAAPAPLPYIALS